MRMNINTNMERAMEYAVYMMIGDEFIRTKCISNWKEKGLLVNYKEVKCKIQYQLEDISIRYVNVLKEILPQDFFNTTARVQFIERIGYVPEVRFITENYMLIIFCIYAGNKTKLKHRLLVKAA